MIGLAFSPLTRKGPKGCNSLTDSKVWMKGSKRFCFYASVFRGFFMSRTAEPGNEVNMNRIRHDEVIPGDDQAALSVHEASADLSEAKSETERHHSQTRKMAKIAILSSIAFVLMLFEFPLPLMPGFLKFDFSEIAALLAGFSMGPWAGITVELIKNLLHLPFTHTLMIGELANFLTSACFVGLASWIYSRNKTLRNATMGMIVGTVALIISGAIFNYFINIPFYISVMGFPEEAIYGASQAAGNHMVHDMGSLILWVFVPFNLFKGAVISLIVRVIYKPLSPILHR